MRISLLKVRPDKIGDILLTTPLISALRQTIPEAHLSLWVAPALIPLLEANEDVDECVPTSFRPPFRDFSGHIRRMRQEDVFLFLKDRAGTHIPLAKLAGVRRRVGSVRKWYGACLTENLPMRWDDDPVHEAELCLRMAEQALGVELPRLPTRMPLTPAALREADSLGLGEGYFCVQPATSGTSRMWDPVKFGRVAREVARATGLACVVTGGPADREVAEQVAEIAGGRSIAATFGLQTLGAVLRGSRGLLTGNTGTMHVAAAQETPIVLVEPMPDAVPRTQKWHPWMASYEGVLATSVCPGCTVDECVLAGNACVDSIAEDDVIAACLRQFGGGMPAAPESVTG